MKAISNLKRAGYAGVAVVLALTAVPVWPVANTWADGESCEGPTTTNELKTALNAGGTVTLCGDIEGGVNVGYGVSDSINVLLNLNGHNITAGNNGQALIVSSNASVTINGDGTLNRSNKGLITVNGSLVINGGTYNGLINTVGGSITINDGTFTSDDSIFGLGHTDGANLTDTLTINGGIFTGNYIANKAYAGGGTNSALTINDGDFREVTSGITKSNSLQSITNIYGGEYGADPTGYEADGLDVYSYTDTANYWRVGSESGLTAESTIIAALGERVELFRATPAEYSELSYDVLNTNGADVSSAVTIEEVEENGEIVGYITANAQGRKEIDIHNNSGDTVHVKFLAYEIQGVTDQIMVVDTEKEITEIKSNKWGIDWSLSTEDEAVEIVDGKTIKALSSGTATVTVTFDDNAQSQAEFTVYVYDFESEDDEILIARGETADVDTDSYWQANPTSSADGVVEISERANDGSFTVTGETVGVTEVTFAIDVNGEVYEKTVKVHVYEAGNFGTVLVAKDNTASLPAEVEADDEVSYTIYAEDGAIATADGDNQGGYTANGVSVGETKVYADISVNNVEPVTVELGAIRVYNFVTDAEDQDLAVGGEYTFTASEENTDGVVAVEADSDDIAIVDNGDGTWTITLSDEIAGGSYDITVTDTFGDTTVVTEHFTVRVHELVINGDAEHYIVLTRNPMNQEQNRYTVNVTELSGFTANRDITYSVVDASTLNGISVEYRHGGNWRITGQNAGSYTVEFTDGVASASIKVYVMQFTFEQDSYHVKREDGSAGRVINAINDYWHEINVAEGYVDTKFVVVNDETGETVVESDGYEYVGSRTEAESDKHTFKWCNEAGDCLEAGNYTITFEAYANRGDDHGGKTASKIVRLHVYEMSAPDYDLRFVETGNSLTVDAKDNNSNSSLWRVSATVDGPANGLSFGGSWFNRDYTDITVNQPGVYTVHYTDSMVRTGEEIGTYDLTIVAIEVEEETLLVRKGNTVEITGNNAWAPSVANEWYTGVDYIAEENSDGDSVIVFDATDLEVGEYYVEVAHDFTEFDEGDFPPREVIKYATVIVYDIVADEETDPEGITADTLQAYLDQISAEGLADELLGGAGGWFGPITDLWNLFMLAMRDDSVELFGQYEAFGSLEGLRDALNDGATIETRVEVTPYEDEDLVDEALKNLIAVLTTDGVKYYDISVIMSVDGEDFGRLHQLIDDITVKVDEVENPADGYIREFTVARQHEGEEPEILIENVDWYIDEKNVLYIVANRFSTYAIAYTDTLIPAVPDTGADVDEISGTMVSTLAMIMALVAMTSMAGAVAFAKRK